MHLVQMVDGGPVTSGAKAARGEIGLHVEHREANLADRFAVALFPHRAERHRFGGRRAIMIGEQRRERGRAAAEIITLADDRSERSEEHTSELQSLMRISYAVFCLHKK